ncbi:hypothetical protein SU69_05425 [Thermosipho melanesiensis]|uniref:DUF1659 domain-containing protein n=2 Tax=Thermosipho melanesiensis TaxID=46541 RepID=A6LLX1_THEM4|nr:hypothetical protein [Thermosipho melanesiensis]ABR30922.1 hypothetical protein Tmel_1062 [Thermosipho melanesiensis BI429]APT74039.1 hypothetical protein BW47_05675 [Thermosipho melanesiensis]OOC35967.1 hypothetical protein SU68_05485 [Thermosipho melanesiensis]OOC38106.1 hypothetical protein SU69_05425 [Thermosipho melanesiensis]OOC38236.1 hypothetical protein SU70_05435 [Thermosipho melanesiensis]
MKRLSIRWLVGVSDGKEVYKRQTLNVQEIDVTKAANITQILSKYTTYTLDSATLVTFESVM